MKSMQLEHYSQQFRACSLAALVLVGFTSVGAIAGNVHGSAPDVNQVFGRASAIPTQGAPARTAGLSVDAFGRASNIGGKAAMSAKIATRSPEGLVAEYGRGSPTLAQRGDSGKLAKAK